MVYGLIIENELFHMKKMVSQERYDKLIQSIHLKEPAIDVTKRYPENLWTKVGKKASQSLGIEEAEFYEGVGQAFVKFVEAFKFDQLTSLIGREVREFVMNLDNVHHYLGEMFTFMKAPSFFVESETPTGLTLVYRSKRRGYCYYTIGQMKEISKVFFDTIIDMKPIKQEIQFDTVYIKYQVNFDNKAYLRHLDEMQRRFEASLPFKAFALFEVFPFSVLLDQELNIVVVGNALRKIIPGCVGKSFSQWFKLERPLVEFKWDNLLTKTNNVFVFQLMIRGEKTGRLRKYKLQSMPDPEPEVTEAIHGGEEGQLKEEVEEVLDDEFKLHIRGQLVYIEEWKKLVFLGCPMIPNLKRMIENGLFISDMSTHDLSRDIMMAQIQKQFEKRMTINLEEKSKTKMEDMRSKIEALKEENTFRRMAWIPRDILATVTDEKDLIKIHPRVTLLHARLHDLDDICRKTMLVPNKFIELLDNALSAFDHLAKKNNVLRVETVDHYLAVGGILDPEPEDEESRVATLALDLKDAAHESLRDPSIRRKVMMKFCIGIVEGPVIAATVGQLMPKFCILGPLVQEAEKMSEVCPPGKILMSPEIKSRIQNVCRYSNPSSSVMEQLQRPAFALDNMQDHIKVPVAPVLRAYAKFKHAKIQNDINHNVNGKNGNLILDEDEIIRQMTRNGRMGLCSPHGSAICTLF